MLVASFNTKDTIKQGYLTMKKIDFISLPVLGFLSSLMLAGTSQAAYICTGASGSADNSDPYFNGDLTSTNCDESEIGDALGITIDNNLIVGSKIDSGEDGNGDLDSWSETENGLGTITVLPGYGNTSGTFSLAGSTVPLFYVVKYDAGYDVYGYMGSPTSPFTDSWDATVRGTVGDSCRAGPGEVGINCLANVSHVSVYGEVPIPAAVWLFGTGLIGLAGIARGKKA